MKRMPERMNNSGAKHFLKDVQPLLNADRPQVVFDLSQVQQLDVAGVEVLAYRARVTPTEIRLEERIPVVCP